MLFNNQVINKSKGMSQQRSCRLLEECMMAAYYPRWYTAPEWRIGTSGICSALSVS